MNDNNGNIGEVGVKSIRLRGRRIEDLPLGQGNDAKEQLGIVIKQERLNNIDSINAKYPKHRIDYLRSRIKECLENIDRINRTQLDQSTMIGDYRGYISLCEHREKEVTKLNMKLLDNKVTFEQHCDQVKALKKKYPPYDIAAMEKQIVQCNEAIQRCIDVIKQENDSIIEFSEVQALCEQRDRELAQYGAVAEGS